MTTRKKSNEHTKNHRTRVRDKFAKLSNFDSYEPYEVLELLLFYAIPRRDTKPIAKRLIATFGSVKAVLLADISTLIKQPGVGMSTAVFLSSFSKLNNYISQEQADEIRGSGDLGAYAVQLTKGKKLEEFYVIALNATEKIINYKRLATGNLFSVAIEFKDVISFALETSAASLALVHNHTNGVLVPSSEDKIMTEKIMKVLSVLGIRLVDHIITCEDRYFSMAEINIPNFRGAHQ